MSFIKNPGSIVVLNPFYTDVFNHYQTYVGMDEDRGLNVYYNLRGGDNECFIASCPYPYYRIQEFDILLKPEPAVCYGRGILWHYGGFYMFVNYKHELLLTKSVTPGIFFDPDETIQEKEYWVLDHNAWSDTVSEKTLIGKHCRDAAENITVVKEFPRWIRRPDVNGIPHRRNLPCGYYDPVDGAEGTLLIGNPLEPSIYTDNLYDGKESTVITYLGEAMTWKQ